MNTPEVPPPAFRCMWADCRSEITEGDALYCKKHVKLADKVWHAEPGSKMSIPPDKRSASYVLAFTLITSAASSAVGIANPLHRTLVIILLAVVVYVIGLRTQ